MVLNELQLRRLVRRSFAYYHGFRTHLALEKDTPEPRPVEPPGRGKIVEFPMVGDVRCSAPTCTFIWRSPEDHAQKRRPFLDRGQTTRDKWLSPIP